MSKHCIQPLDSYRLAQYAVPVECHVCGEGNTFDADRCRYCFAPMSLVQRANSPKTAPKMITAWGSAGSGKTVYLSMLMDALSRQSGDLDVLARGALSISHLQEVIRDLSRCRFPVRTPREPETWNWLHCQVKTRRQRRGSEIVVPDMSGAALLDEIERTGACPVVRPFVEKCSAAIVFVDVAEVEAGEQSQDYFAMQALNYLCGLNDDRRKGWPNRPVAVVFTKADLSPSCQVDPAAYAQRHTPGLWQACQKRLHRHRFFAVRVAGACAYQWQSGRRVAVPLRIEPHGIVEPFRWLVEELAR